MPTDSRIYLVLAGDKSYLVRAETPARARNHIRAQLVPTVAASIASQTTLVSLLTAGETVQDATKAQQVDIEDADAKG